MSLSAADRKTLADLAARAYTVVEQAITIYAKSAEMPRRFGLGVYDASDGGAGFDPASLESRMIADFRIDPADWADRDYIVTLRRKLNVAIRTGRNSADVARNAPELFIEGDMRAPGGILGEVNGKPIAIGGSGYRGPEDEAFAILLLEAMKRLGGDYVPAPTPPPPNPQP
ncbi:MAG: hypothetical protein EXR58_01160 [Chloroflexi bacterium]|nr:hypothetical protein [Chloroflexota bacterium]